MASENFEDDWFTCRSEKTKLIISIIVCLVDSTRRDQHCAVEATPEGLMFVVTGRTKSTQARVNLQSQLFESFTLSESDSVKFVVNLHLLLECLHLYGTGIATETVTSTFFHSARDATFKLTLEDSGVVTVCDINTLYDEMNDEDNLLAQFRDSPEVCQIIVKSDLLREALQDLMDVSPGAASYSASSSIAGSEGAMTISLLKDPDSLKFSTRGWGGASLSEIEFERSSDTFVSYKNDLKESKNWQYPLHSIWLSVKALSIAKETFLRINSEGHLCMQHLVESTADDVESFIDFLVAPLETYVALN